MLNAEEGSAGIQIGFETTGQKTTDRLTRDLELTVTRLLQNGVHRANKLQVRRNESPRMAHFGHAEHTARSHWIACANSDCSIEVRKDPVYPFGGVLANQSAYFGNLLQRKLGAKMIFQRFMEPDKCDDNSCADDHAP